MKGYWRKEKATNDTKTSDGWMKTGDITYIDEDGKWYVVDRKKYSLINMMIPIFRLRLIMRRNS